MLNLAPGRGARTQVSRDDPVKLLHHHREKTPAKSSVPAPFARFVSDERMLRLDLDELPSAFSRAIRRIDPISLIVTHRHGQSRIVKRVADERPSCSVDVRVLFPEHQRDLAFALQVAAFYLGECVVGLSFAQGCRVDTGVSVVLFLHV